MKVIILRFQRESGQTCGVFSCRPDSWVINLERLQESLWNLNNSIKRKLLFNLHHSSQNLYFFYWLIKSSTHLGPLGTFFFFSLSVFLQMYWWFKSSNYLGPHHFIENVLLNLAIVDLLGLLVTSRKDTAGSAKLAQLGNSFDRDRVREVWPYTLHTALALRNRSDLTCAKINSYLARWSSSFILGPLHWSSIYVFPTSREHIKSSAGVF